MSDIAQEAMLAVWRSIGSYDGSASFQTWVLAVTRRKIADYFRASYKNASLPLDEGAELADDEAVFERVDDALDVESALTGLTASERELVLLAFSAGHTYPEISVITGLPVGTVKSRMHAVKAKLRKQLGERG